MTSKIEYNQSLYHSHTSDQKNFPGVDNHLGCEILNAISKLSTIMPCSLKP